MIAGGSLENGTASDAVYAFAPATGRVLADRPPAGADDARRRRGDRVVAFVIGGRGASTGHADRPDRRRRPVDAARARGRDRSAEPLSDLAAVATARGILLAGGHSADGEPSPTSPSSSASTAHARAASRSACASRTSTRPTASATSARRRGARGRYVYVPNSDSDTVDVIDQRTFKVVEHFGVGALPQHVVPAWDLKTLYVTNDLGNSLTRDRPADRQAGPHDPGRRSVQHVLHARRPLRDRRRGAAAPARLSRRAHVQAASLAAGPLLGRRPHGLLRRRHATRSSAASSRASC